MQYTLAVLALAATTFANPLALSARTPAGCSPNYPGEFSITTVNTTTSTNSKRQVGGGPSTLQISLANGVLTDNEGNTGYIANNTQFQFDNPPQANALSVDGFSVCSNGSLAHLDSAIFYSCVSGGFDNLYNSSVGAQCSPVFINVIPVPAAASSGAASATGSAAPISTISDGQPQATTAASAAAVSTISDHQPQATTAAASVAPISTISDHQPQATTAAQSVAPISTISDHQPQATTAQAVAPISTISDHQPQATTALSAAPTYGNKTSTASIAQFTGAAVPMKASEFMAMVAGAAAVALF